MKTQRDVFQLFTLGPGVCRHQKTGSVWTVGPNVGTAFLQKNCFCVDEALERLVGEREGEGGSRWGAIATQHSVHSQHNTRSTSFYRTGQHYIALAWFKGTDNKNVLCFNIVGFLLPQPYLWGARNLVPPQRCRQCEQDWYPHIHTGALMDADTQT